MNNNVLFAVYGYHIHPTRERLRGFPHFSIVNALKIWYDIIIKYKDLPI